MFLVQFLRQLYSRNKHITNSRTFELEILTQSFRDYFDQKRRFAILGRRSNGDFFQSNTANFGSLFHNFRKSLIFILEDIKRHK